jgi:flavodoxin I
MKKIALFYESVTGNTRQVADSIRHEFGETITAHDITDVHHIDLRDYDLVILGSSTWNMGETDEWDEFLKKFDQSDILDTKFALFGLGDQRGFSDTFVENMGSLYDKLSSMGATVIGHTPITGYEFTGSGAVVNGRFVGLALDNDNQPGETPGRVRRWVSDLKQAIGYAP